jgi:hypothetical protein
MAVCAGCLAVTAPALGTPTRDGWGFAIADDDWNWSNPGDLPALGDSFAQLQPKAFRLQMIWNAAELPWHMDRARAMIARARAQGVQQIVVTFKKSVGQDVDPVYGSQPSAEGYGLRTAEVVRQLAGDVDVWGPANEPNRGEAWLPGASGARLLAEYYASLRDTVAALDPSAEITSPDLVDRGDLGSIVRYVEPYEEAGGGWGDYIAWHPYAGVHQKTTQTTLDLMSLAPADSDVWITEVGAFGRSPGGVNDPEPVQNDKVWWLATVLAELPRVTRIHYYHMRGSPQSSWDTALTNPDGSRRLAWKTWWCMTQGPAVEDPDCQPPGGVPPAEPPGPPGPPPAPAPAPAVAISSNAFDGSAGTTAAAAETPDLTPPAVTVDRLPRRLRYGAFLRGVRLRLTPDEPTAFVVRLLVRRPGEASARVRYGVVSKKVLDVSSEARSLRLRPRRDRLGEKPAFAVRVRIEATDLGGNRRVVSRSLRVLGDS